MQTALNTTAAGGVSQLAPSRPQPVPWSSRAGPLDSAGPTAVQPGFVPGRSGGSGGPPPPDGRFFNNPLNIRAIITGSSDGYRSPEPPSRLDTLSPLHYLHRDRLIPGGGPSGSNLMGMEGFRPSFSASHPTATQPPNNPGPGMEYGNGSSVLPVELIAYNDLMMDIGTAQYLGAEIQEPVANSSTPTNDGGGINSSGSGTNGYQLQGVSHHVPHEPPQTMSSFGFSQPGQPSCGVSHISTQQASTNSWVRRPVGGITDYG